MKKSVQEPAKVRQKDKEAELDARIKAIREQEQRRMQRRKEVEEDREERERAADSDKARVSVCTRYRRSPSPEQAADAPASPAAATGRHFLHDPARDVQPSQERARQRERERDRPLDPSRMTARQRREHERWLQERNNIDQQRLQRARTPDGGWRREWDREKQPDTRLRDDCRQQQRRGRGQQWSRADPAPPHSSRGVRPATDSARGVRPVTESGRAVRPAGEAVHQPCASQVQQEPATGERRRRRRGGRRRRGAAAAGPAAADRSPSPRQRQQDTPPRDEEEQELAAQADAPLLELIHQSSEAPEPHYDELRDLRDYEEDYTADEPGIYDASREQRSSGSSEDDGGGHGAVAPSGPSVAVDDAGQPRNGAVSPISALLSSAAPSLPNGGAGPGPSQAAAVLPSPVPGRSPTKSEPALRPVADPSAVLTVARNLAQLTGCPAAEDGTAQLADPVQGYGTAPLLHGFPVSHPAQGYSTSPPVQVYGSTVTTQAYGGTAATQGYSTSPAEGYSAAIPDQYSALPSEHGYSGPLPTPAYSAATPVRGYSASPPVPGYSASPPVAGYSASPPVQCYGVPAGRSPAIGTPPMSFQERAPVTAVTLASYSVPPPVHAPYSTPPPAVDANACYPPPGAYPPPACVDSAAPPLPAHSPALYSQPRRAAELQQLAAGQELTQLQSGGDAGAGFGGQWTPEGKDASWAEQSTPATGTGASSVRRPEEKVAAAAIPTARPSTDSDRYVPPHARRAALQTAAPAPKPSPPPSRSTIQCVTFVDGKMVEGDFDESVFKIQDIRLKDGTL